MFQKKRKASRYHQGFIQNTKPRPLLTNRSTILKIPKKKSDFLQKIKQTGTAIIGGGVIIFLIYFVSYSETVKIKNIIFSNDKTNILLQEEIRKLLKPTIGENIFLLEKEKLAIKILEKIKQLEKVKIKKKYFNSLIVEFTEFPFSVNLINESETVKKSMILNSLGYVVKENYEDPKLPYIKIKTEEPLNPKNSIIEPKKLEYILNAKKYFEEKFGMKIKEIIYKPIPRELHLQTEKDFTLWLDLQVPFEEQFKKLKKGLVKLDIYNTPLQYIDLRISGGKSGEKIIYKKR